MMFRSIALATTMSLLLAAVSTTAHAGENTAARDLAAAPMTPPGAVLPGAPSRRPAPKVGVRRVARDLLIGAGGGAAMAVGLGAVAFIGLYDGRREKQDDHAAIAAVIGLVAYPGGAGTGVAMLGTRGEVYGSATKTIQGAYLGSLGGALLGGLVGHAIGPDEGGGASAGALLGYLIGAPIGATIAWNVTLKDHQPGTGLVNVSGGRTRMSIPAVSLAPDPLRLQGTVASVRLMDGRF
jgi:hypothetical protein